ncbi:hypothetical protein INT43_004449 [Umbelopsis isabellina]|uniref:Uncharacterized protein n=1 Tax=Mortierella isabellina TaxID=91625 RepID=A0A8H7U7M4_MORIS|nr:hypothetical protein INT43_004449 [Umbelopsis isabellina]
MSQARLSQKKQYYDSNSPSTRTPRSTARKPASGKQEQFIGPMPLPTEFKSPSASIGLSVEKMSMMSNILSTMSLKNQDERISGLMRLMSEEDLSFIIDDVVEQTGPKLGCSFVPCDGNMGILCLPEDAYLKCFENQIKDNSNANALMEAMRNVPFDLVLQEHVANMRNSKSKKVATPRVPASKKPEFKSNGLTKAKEPSFQETKTIRLATMKDMSEIEGEKADGLNDKQGVKPDMQTETCHSDEAAVDQRQVKSSNMKSGNSADINLLGEEDQSKQNTEVAAINIFKIQHEESSREMPLGEGHSQGNQEVEKSKQTDKMLEHERLLSDRTRRENQKRLDMGSGYNNIDKRYRKYLYERVRLCEVETVSTLLKMIPVPDQLQSHDLPFPATIAAQSLELWEDYERTKDGISLISANNGVQETLLHVAIKTGSLELVKLFLKRGAPLAAVDSSGRYPLHIAAHSSSASLDIIKLLIEYGPVRYIDIQTMDTQETCLHIAASNNNTELIQLLLTMHAKVHFVNSDGQTAERVARLQLKQYKNKCKSNSKDFSAQMHECQKAVDIFIQNRIMLEECQAKKDELEKEKQRQEAIKLHREQQEDEKIRRKQEEKVQHEARKRQKEEELLITMIKSTSSNKKKKKAKDKSKAPHFSSDEQEQELNDKQFSHDYPTPPQEHSTLSIIPGNHNSMNFTKNTDISSHPYRSVETQTEPLLQQDFSAFDISHSHTLVDIARNVDQSHRSIHDAFWTNDANVFEEPPIHSLSKQFDHMPLPSDSQYCSFEVEYQCSRVSDSSTLLSTASQDNDLLNETWKTTDNMAKQGFGGNILQQPGFHHARSLHQAVSDIEHEMHPDTHFNRVIAPIGRQPSNLARAGQIQPNGSLLGWSSFPKKLKYPPGLGIDPSSSSSQRYLTSQDKHQFAASASDVQAYLPQFSLFG